MSYTFIELDIFSAVGSEYYGRVLTSADSPIEVPLYEAEPWIKGQYALPRGPSVELSEEASAELQNLLQQTTAQFLEEYRRNESWTTETPRGVREDIGDEHAGPDDAGAGDGSGVVGGSNPDDGAGT